MMEEKSVIVSGGGRGGSEQGTHGELIQRPGNGKLLLRVRLLEQLKKNICM